jgi:hypothetical protein
MSPVEKSSQSIDVSKRRKLISVVLRDVVLSNCGGQPSKQKKAEHSAYRKTMPDYLD